MARYINADALIEAIKHELWDWETLDGITSTTVLKQTITDIQNTPTADVVELEGSKVCKCLSYTTTGIPTADVVERKKGKWIESYIGGICSNCGYNHSFYIGTSPSIEAARNFCPNCGAQMDERKEDDGEIR